MDRIYRLPPFNTRLDAALLEAHTERLGAELADPIKTTVVHKQRSMTTWVMRKNVL